MNIAIVGCGYVADHYMETLSNHDNLSLQGVVDLDRSRAEILAGYYGTRAYANTEEVLADPAVEIVVNLTDPDNHYAVSRASLLAGKHVYSEKPLAPDLEQARELVALAQEKQLLISSAPCSALSETAQTLWKAVEDGAVGRPRLVYAELDDNPVYRMKPEGWTNARGVPWPYLNEYEVGCTLEHAGYYLTWLAAIFGPATSITAFSSCQVPDKTPLPLDRGDTPDLSVACILFKSGVVARLTCSIVAPYDHRLRIIGDKGMLAVDECWQYGAPVYLERFSQMSLNARKFRSIRTSTFWSRLFGIGGRRQVFVSKPRSQCRARWNDLKTGRRSLIGTLIKALGKRELVAMDFFRGVAEMARSLEENRPCQLSPDFVLHVNEMTLAMQNASTHSNTYRLTTTFEPIAQASATRDSAHNYADARPGRVASLFESLIARLHKH